MAVSYTHLDVYKRQEYIQQFMYETFNTPFYLQRSIEVNYSSFTAEWQIKGKSSVSYNDVAAYKMCIRDRGRVSHYCFPPLQVPVP